MSSQEWLCGSMCLLVGCSNFDEEFGGSTWEGRHFTYRTRGDESRACPGVVESLDRYAETVADYLRIDLEGLAPLRYYKYLDSADFKASGSCGGGANGCTDGTEIHSYLPIHGHEIVHAVAAIETGIDMAPLLGEGTAAGLSCMDPFGIEKRDWHWRSFWSDPEVAPGTDNAYAGRLMLALANETGPRSLVELAKLLGVGSSADRIHQVVQDETGIDLDSLAVSAADDYRRFCLPLDLCAGEELEPGFTDLAVTCSGPPRKRTPIQSSALGRFYFEGGPVRFLSCGSDPSPIDLSGQSLYDGPELVDHLVPLERSYALWLDNSEYGIDTHANVTFEPLIGVYGPTCSLEASYPLSLGRKTALVLTGGDPPMFFNVATNRPRPISVYLKRIESMPGDAPPPAPRVSYCPSCLDCWDLDPNRVEEILIDGKGSFLIRSDVALRPARELVIQPRYSDGE